MSLDKKLDKYIITLRPDDDGDTEKIKENGSVWPVRNHHEDIESIHYVLWLLIPTLSLPLLPRYHLFLDNMGLYTLSELYRKNKQINKNTQT